jgi:hypothetical protein
MLQAATARLKKSFEVGERAEPGAPEPPAVLRPSLKLLPDLPVQACDIIADRKISREWLA